MKNKLIALCVVTTVVTSVTGCGCCRRLRDFVCRGARCGGPATIAAPAPIMTPPPVAPLSYDPGCNYGGIAGYDPGCAYPSGGQMVGYPPAYDSGWVPGGPACESCSGGYAMPGYSGAAPSGEYLVDPNVSGGPLPIDPGPATGGVPR